MGRLALARGVTSVAFACASVACAGDDAPRVESATASLDAYCVATVIGTGQVDVELDYLPHVVNCENGGASFEALKAQAVAARSYLYYRLDRTGDIGDGTGDQVFSCGREPSMLHYMAVEATSGQVLQYQGTQVAAFYVAGAKQDPPECRGGTDDPTNTERFVTYNWGLSGDAIEQTSLGFVDPDNHANRGCKSQNGADCLSDDGWVHDDILRFYYGMDIELVQAEGPCITPPDTGGADAGDSTAVDAGPELAPDAGPGVDTEGEVSGGCSIAGRAGAGDAWLVIAILLAGIGMSTGRRASWY